MTVTIQTKERLIDKLRNELYKKHSWTGETAVKFMVPIILAIRYKDAQAMAENTPEDDAILWALNELRTGGKRELDDTLVQVKAQYHGVSPLLQETLDGMISFVTRQPDGIIFDVLDYLDRNRDLLRALRDEDFIGSLFERSVSDAFRGDDGRFFTPRSVILIVREMMRLLEHKLQPERKISEYTVCDPCCGSARFLIYWSEYIKDEIEQELRQQQAIVPRPQLLAKLKETAERTLFGADIHEDTAAYGCLNMLLHGDGATNIANLDSLDHFGFFADMPLLWEFAQEFQKKWAGYNNGPVRNRQDLIPQLYDIEAKKGVIADLLEADEIDLSDSKWLNVMRVIRLLLEVDNAYPTQWDSVQAIQRRFKRRAVFETMTDEWTRRNPDIANGFDILITNPPFGRKSELQIDDSFTLSQYKLATEMWVRDMSKGMTESLLSRTLAKDKGVPEYYIGLVRQHFGKEYVDNADEAPFVRLPVRILRRLAEANGIETRGQAKSNLTEALVEALERRVIDQADEIKLSDLSASEAKRVCSEYLYDGNNPDEVLAGEIVAHFGKEWLTVEDIEGPDGYASKVTLVFNGELHTIYYDSAGKPIVYKNPLPKQVLFIEQFLRMVRKGGKVFTVLDVGVLNNVGDEYVRQFIYKNARVHAIVEFPHGAFKAAKANVKTAIILYEKGAPLSDDRSVLLSVPQYLGFRLNDQNVPCIQENDLGRVLCDYSVTLGLGTLSPDCDSPSQRANGEGLEHVYCRWRRTRVCEYWLKEVDPADVHCSSERKPREFDILSAAADTSRLCLEQRMDPKFYVFELRFETLAQHFSQEGVEVRTVAEIAREPIHRGCQPDYDDLQGVIRVLKTVDVQNRKVNWKSCRRVTEEFYRNQPSAQLTSGDIVLTSTGEGSWGRAAICDVERALADGHLTILRVNTDIVDSYAALAFLWSEYGLMQFEQRVRGSTGQTEIYPQDIEKIKILIPAEDDQQLIARKIREQFTFLDEAERLRREVIQDVEYLLGGAK
jgi:type I restriction-modification system DNA methylase subunit